MGIATSRFEDRIGASIGLSGHGEVKFEKSEALCGAGVLFVLPALIEHGLFKTKQVYELPSSHYYGLRSILLTLAFMALLRIKNPERLKQCKPGEIGRIIGLDRIPEVRCLREKIDLLSKQEKAVELNNLLIDHWYTDKDNENSSFLYIDGHQRIYYGSKANLPVKYISRQKLCLSATTEYWVHDAQGMPVMMVIGQLSEKLKDAIEDLVIPQMLQTKLLSEIQEHQDRQSPQCTFIFDREAYEPAFFNHLWEKYRIAVITYRKNVQDLWNKGGFESTHTQVLSQDITMQLCEKEVTLGGHTFREIRSLTEKSEHQTAIITTHPSLGIALIAGRMFGRWCQENFFSYLIQDYDFDKMIQFGVESIDPNREVVNPQYRKLTNQLKKIREKITRLEAKFFPLAEVAMDEKIDKLPEITERQMKYKTKIDMHRKQENKLVTLRSDIPPRITLENMPEQKRYNKLKTESKLLMNVIKMIAYRAESSVAALACDHLKRAKDEKRMFVKQIITNNADLIPDYQNKTLTITLHSLSAPRFNYAAKQIADLLNKTETIFPGSNLRMIFKTSADLLCER